MAERSLDPLRRTEAFMHAALLLLTLLPYTFLPQPRRQTHEDDRIVPSDGSNYDAFSFAIGLSGERVLITAPGDDPSGSTYVFDRASDATWMEVTKLTPTAGADSDLGTAVSLWNDRAVVTMPDETIMGFLGAGSAWLLERDGAGAWQLVKKLKAPDPAAFDFFGTSVAVFGDSIWIGAPLDDGSSVVKDVGSTYLFEPGSGGGWSQITKWQASDAAAYAHFGMSVSMFGARALVGAPGKQSVYVFERDAGGI
jgi:hypothetical protein